MTAKLSAYKIYIIYSLVTAFLFSMVFTVNLVYQVEILNLNPLQLVLVGTVLEATCFLFEIPTGIVADLYSRKLSVLIGLVLTGFGFIVEGAVPYFAAVLTAQVLWGVGYTFISGAIDAWIAEEEKVINLDRIYLRGARIGEVGSAVGILIGTGLGNVSLSLPIITGGSLFLGLTLFLLGFMPENNFTPTKDLKTGILRNMGNTFVSGFTQVKGNKEIRRLLLITLFYGLSSEGFDRLYTVHFLKDTVLPKIGGFGSVTWFGIFSMAGTVLSITALHLAEKLMKSKLNQVLFLIYINSFTIVGILVFALTKDFKVMLAAYLLTGCFKTINNPVYNTRLNGFIEENARATVLSVSGQINALGQILGGPLIGFIAAKISGSLGIFYTGLLLIPTVAIYAFSLREEKRNHVSS